MAKAFKKHRILLAVWLFTLPLFVCAQGRVQYSWEQFVDDYYEYIADIVDESDNYVERYDWLEELEEMHRNRIDINSCERDELLALRFLSEQQIDSLLSKRNRYAGGIESVGELMAIPQLGYRERAWLSLFLTFNSPPPKEADKGAGATSSRQNGAKFLRNSRYSASQQGTNRWYGGTYEVLGTLDVPLYRRAGFDDYDDTNYETKMFTGYNFAHTLRLRYNWHQRVMYGVTLQEDVGERFGAYGGRPWDFQSFHFFYKNRLTAAVGDYKVALGQGLIVGGNGWMQQTSLFTGPRMEGVNIRPHTGTDESRFLRGAAVRMPFGARGQWDVTAFASVRQLDGTLKSDAVSDEEYAADNDHDAASDDIEETEPIGEYITAWKTDGLHRTLQEIGKRHVAQQLIVGGRAGYSSRSITLGVNGVWMHYDKPYLPAPRSYNINYMRGQDASAASLDYTYRRQQWSLQGELAVDRHANYASTATLRFRPHRRVMLVVQERSVSERFVSPYGRTLMANSQIQNEHAVFAGVQWRATARLQLSAYGDWAYHPCPVYLADTLSHRCSAMLQASLRTGDRWTHTLSYRIKSREQNVTGYRDIPGFEDVLLSWRTTQHVRWQSHYGVGRWSLAVGADGACYFSQGSAYDKKTDVITGAGNSLGAMLYARGAAKLLNERLRLTAMIAGFATDDYNARCYAYIPQLRGSASIPNFYGKGVSGVLMAECRTWRELYVAARLSMVHYYDREQISSGITLIDSPSKNDLSLQLRYRF